MVNIVLFFYKINRIRYNKAAKQDHPEAQRQLGIITFDFNISQSLYWFKKSANQRNKASRRDVAMFYYEGNVVKKGKKNKTFFKSN